MFQMIQQISYSIIFFRKYFDWQSIIFSIVFLLGWGVRHKTQKIRKLFTHKNVCSSEKKYFYFLFLYTFPPYLYIDANFLKFIEIFLMYDKSDSFGNNIKIH